ncbi:hypothetical protein TrLO_g2056 [Triparma laevis f. longispina]|uniref:Uncharacterized protein n=1 Tax=Triparma laevis f. longispina TaxID=1714387 RepID=A0A9W7KRS0_9STRA|nr:hypothetical protein TrLO_g2056 [Triparma laevis f. longispina]
MSKSVATESNEGHKCDKTGVKRGEEYEGDEDEKEFIEGPSAESLPILTVVPTVPATTDQFMFTEDFKGLLVGLVMEDTLMTRMLATKAWKLLVDAFIDEGVRAHALAWAVNLVVVDTPEGIESIGEGASCECHTLPDPTFEVVAHLRSKQQAEAEQTEADRIKLEADRIKQEKNGVRARRLQQR